MDWSNCPDVEKVPGRTSGAWVVVGTRVPADAIVENAAEGYSPDEIAGAIYPSVPVAAVRRVLEFASTKPHAVHTAR